MTVKTLWSRSRPCKCSTSGSEMGSEMWSQDAELEQIGATVNLCSVFGSGSVQATRKRKMGLGPVKRAEGTRPNESRKLGGRGHTIAKVWCGHGPNYNTNWQGWFLRMTSSHEAARESNMLGSHMLRPRSSLERWLYSVSDLAMYKGPPGVFRRRGLDDTCSFLGLAS